MFVRQFKDIRFFLPKTLHALAVAEMVLLVMVFCLVAYVSTIYIHQNELHISVILVSVLSASIILCTMAGIGLYLRDINSQNTKKWLLFGVAYMIGVALIFLFFYLFPQSSFEDGSFVLALTLGFFGILILRGVFYKMIENGSFRDRFLVLGAGKKASALKNTKFNNVDLVGFVSLNKNDKDYSMNTVALAEGQSLSKLCETNRASGVIIALDDRRKSIPLEDLLECKMKGLRVLDVNQFHEWQQRIVNVNDLNPGCIIFSDDFLIKRTTSFSKRLLDIVISFIVLIFALPIALLAMLAIYIESGGHDPIIFRQKRVGKDNKVFTLLKFRTMKVDAEKDGKAQWARSGDPRVTRIGGFLRKYRIDEIPQLFNVFQGDMSFIGPRPERPEFVTELAAKIPYYSLRHKIKPGLTGWAQVSYAYGASDEDALKKLQYDLYYMKNYSMLLDLNILVQTVHTVLLGKGAR